MAPAMAPAMAPGALPVFFPPARVLFWLVLSVAVCASLWSPGLAQVLPAEPSYYAETTPAPPPADAVILPSGSALHVVLQTPISTALNHPGDPVEAAVSQALFMGSTEVLSRHARLLGRITALEQPVQGKNALLGIRFERLTLEDGQQIPLSAHVRTDRPEHVWGGELTPGTKPRAIPYHVWGIGAYNRIVLEGPRQMGAHCQFLPGERMTVILEAPVFLPTAPP